MKKEELWGLGRSGWRGVECGVRVDRDIGDRSKKVRKEGQGN